MGEKLNMKMNYKNDLKKIIIGKIEKADIMQFS